MRRAAHSLALLFSLATAGCGATGAPMFGELTLPDVAPWLDLGPVAICEGALRIGRPDSQPAGLCLDAAPAPSACAADSDCKSRERCTCAGCQVAYCEAGDECSTGDVCTFSDHRCDRPCQLDTDCAAGEICPPGVNVCRARCATSADCQSGEVCDGDSGLCATSMGSAGTPCATNADCADHPTCALQREPGDLREPDPLLDGGALLLYLERFDGTRSAIWRAVAIAGRAEGQWFRIDPATAIVTPGAADAARAGAPSVLPPGATGSDYQMAFADGLGHLRSARSPDGIAFTVDATPLLVPLAAWQSSGLDAPSLVSAAQAPGGQPLLYFATSDGGAIGLAVAGGAMTYAATSTPLLTPASVTDPVLWRGVDRVGSPFAQSLTSAAGAPTLHLFFDAHGSESMDAQQFGVAVAEPPNDSIGVALTSDGRALVPWPYDPVFDRVQQFLDHGSERQPAVVDLGGSQLLYYRAADAGGANVENLRVARNPAN